MFTLFAHVKTSSLLRLSSYYYMNSATVNQKPPLTFEFTKRKRWGDLLITELADCIILILSPACKVLYCGTAITEILGWKDVDLIDHDFLRLVRG